MSSHSDPSVYFFQTLMPGLRRENIDVQEGRYLEITGEQKEGKVMENVMNVRGEIGARILHQSKTFTWKIELPDDAQGAEAVTLEVEDGLVTVTVPKMETEPFKDKYIDIASVGTEQLPSCSYRQ